jgi:hypothetical protein
MDRLVAVIKVIADAQGNKEQLGKLSRFADGKANLEHFKGREADLQRRLSQFVRPSSDQAAQRDRVSYHSSRCN